MSESIKTFLRSLAANFDCDIGANEAHSPHCRTCEAKELLARFNCGSAAAGESPSHSGRADKWWALIQGGIGPDVWDKEVEFSAADFMDAAGQANGKAEEYGGHVVWLEVSV